MALQHVSLVPLWGAPLQCCSALPQRTPSVNDGFSCPALVSGDPGRGLSLKVHGSPLTGPSAFPAHQRRNAHLADHIGRHRHLDTSPSLVSSVLREKTIRCGSGDILLVLACPVLTSFANLHLFSPSSELASQYTRLPEVVSD
ncbi:hypothetical protein N658DRAFT_248737 [Parathielavia hyrcaniae]|uniref:Secreted protein n=1 Tax=Parathielavia hyrcaniae TaxID=113614 RepID=A0AAN6Q640_9PEZI|nr:hypothetical protein N658DRAFT_248737 [Parathielavia hyrcaniae]